MADWIQGLAPGQWYEQHGAPFEIVGVDTANESVLIQHFDGSLEEYDFDAWMELRAVRCAPPEDWSGALDVTGDDYGVDRDSAGKLSRWDSPLDQFDYY